MNSQSNKIRCPSTGCEYFGRGDNVRQHLKKKHKYNEDQILEYNRQLQSMKRPKGSGNVWICPAQNCIVSCSMKNGLISHIYSKHPSEKSHLMKIMKQDDKEHEELEVVEHQSYTNIKVQEPVKFRCLESKCSVSTASREDLCKHMKSKHSDGTQFVVETENFDSYVQFKDWFDRKKEASCSTFAKCRTHTDGKLKANYWRCSNEGEYESNATKTRGHPSKKTTGKGNICTAFVKLIENADGSCSVKACFSHKGHEVEPAQQRLTDPQIKLITDMIEDSWTNEQIIKKLIKVYPETNRLHHVINEDISGNNSDRTIRDRFGLHDGRLHENDLESIKMRYNEQNPKYGLRFLRLPIDKKGTGFILVIMSDLQIIALKKFSHKGVVLDETYNISRYDVRLTTMLVLDENSRGIPCGFLISNCTSTEEMRFFFREVKKVFPEFCPKVMMTDEAGQFWNAYVYEFPQNRNITKKLWCRWHVGNAWQNMADRLLNDVENKTVMQKLYEIQLTPSEFVLQRGLNELFQYLKRLGNSKALQFLKYLKSRYLKTVKVWATCYRDNSIVQTSMTAESWHAYLKASWT
ncbi:unnamed protein product [Caenorhabditis angaria]|uniref:C2H2-type domain-containing protein n=1 Tax=Caenorhabditis angaria TaxID=860376 RepID=A0A9P1N6U8_9PELO|nr:unnamed protein product [Caenorhabditis angaria]CAI5452000.1 unnamed protein product [Caenorhabditis angaria]CAI5452004.1 unnamed protein product [Caenorhabditis angaria]